MFSSEQPKFIASRPWSARLWASRWPEVIWFAFAFGNLGWMVLIPSWSMLPYHLTWMSLLLLYGLGVRTWSRMLAWCLLLPVMAATAIVFFADHIQGPQPFDELIELPVMAVMLFVMMRLTNHRRAAMDRLDAVSSRNVVLLERQRAFVQNASHALRTPITVALAHAELLYPAVVDADAAEDVAVVVDELGRLRGLVDQLLVLATSEQADILHPSPTLLRPLIDEVLHRWEAAPRQWLACRVDDATIFVDRERLIMALDALIDNAVRFTTSGDRIELSVELQNSAVAITVADSGSGIPEEQLGLVFERFQSGASSPRGGRSFGLGLAIVRAVVEAQGGVVLAGRADLGGAAVALTFPLYDPVSRVLPSIVGGPAEVTPQPA